MLGVPRTAAAAASPVIDSPLLDTESTFESQYSNDFAAITQRLQQLEIDYRQLHEELRAMQLGPKVQSALDELEPPSSQRQTSGILATQPSSAAASPPPSRPTASLVADSNVLNVTLSTINQPSKRSGPVDPIGQSSFDCNLSENFSAMRLLADSKETSQKSGFSYRSHSFFTAETSPGRSLMADQLAHESLANYRSFPSRMFDVTALGDVVPDGVNNDQDPLLPTPYSCTSCTRQSASRLLNPSLVVRQFMIPGVTVSQDLARGQCYHGCKLQPQVKHRLSSLVENGIFVLFQDIYLRPTEKPLFKQRTLAIRPDTESSGSLALPLINPPTPPTMYVWLGSKVSPLQRSDAISALLDFRSFHFAVAPAFILLDSHTCGPAKQEMYALLQPK
ncbi:hypothetical protein H4R35_000911 [Dimargaris xerosporica]|nr:hypothetical protein H4R35_000911 [Dimargaris xerosporica]